MSDSSTGNAIGASEHNARMDAEPLQNLTAESGGVGRWLLTVVMPPREETYTWNKFGKSGESKKLWYLLVSDDGEQYCEGSYMNGERTKGHN